MPNKQYTIGKAFDIEELKKPVRARIASPRDQELEKAITQTRGASNLATRPRAGICTSDTRAGTSGR